MILVPILLLRLLAMAPAPARAEGVAAAAEEVKIEVLHLPESCSPKSKKGDLLNAHYDGFLASDGSKFYCRWAAGQLGQRLLTLIPSLTPPPPPHKAFFIFYFLPLS